MILLSDQFFRGLSADNIFEAERFHNLNPDDLEIQEPVVLTSKSSGITQEQLQDYLRRRLRNFTKNFQAQFRQLQARQFISHQSIDNRLNLVRPKPPRRVVQDHQDPDYDDGYVDPDVGDDPGAPAWNFG
ncbi:unnamed protein product [Rhizophagus irregularis]|nr:unnamed protein product [Rhizophagus irregularis]